MTDWHYWKYSEVLERITTSGAIGVLITTAEQQLLKPIMFSIESTVGDDTGGTSESHMSVNLQPSGSDVILLNTVENSIFLPCPDYLGRFKTVDIKDFILGDGDQILIARTFMNVGSIISVNVRALLSNYALPTITMFGTVITSPTYPAAFQNAIVGKIE